MPRQAGKPARLRKQKRLPAKKAGSYLHGFIKIKRYKHSRTIVITINIPPLQKTRKKTHQRTRAPELGSLLNNSLTFGLVVVSFICAGQLILALRGEGSSIASSQTTSTQADSQFTSTEVKPLFLTRAAPTRLEIPAIGLDTELVKIGKKADGSIEVPKYYDKAGWFEYAPTPGEIGPAIIVGHVDSTRGPAVFYNLKKLQPGQIIQVTREDNTVVSFKVDRLELFSQNDFPTEAVYGNLDHAGLRLITCGGQFNYLTRHYSHNVVVYASL